MVRTSRLARSPARTQKARADLIGAGLLASRQSPAFRASGSEVGRPQDLVWALALVWALICACSIRWLAPVQSPATGALSSSESSRSRGRFQRAAESCTAIIGSSCLRVRIRRPRAATSATTSSPIATVSGASESGSGCPSPRSRTARPCGKAARFRARARARVGRTHRFRSLRAISSRQCW